NIFPSAIENFIRETKEFSNEYQLCVPKMGSGEHLTIRIEPVSPDMPPEEMERAVKAFKETIKFRIGITASLEVKEAGSLPRFEGKARRVIRG
ncbi:MAG: phenylacetate--CoA ligase, partial [Deltaproteobacteria bacterium]